MTEVELLRLELHGDDIECHVAVAAHIVIREHRDDVIAGLREAAAALERGAPPFTFPDEPQLRERVVALELKLAEVVAALNGRLAPPWGTRAELIGELKRAHWSLHKSLDQWKEDLPARLGAADLETCEQATLERWLSELLDALEAKKQNTPPAPAETVVDRWARLQWKCHESLKNVIVRHMRTYLAAGHTAEELADLCGILMNRGFTPATLDVKSCQEICKDLATSLRSAELIA
jgi:hypothetical protein